MHHRGTEAHLLQDGEDCTQDIELPLNRPGDARRFALDIAGGECLVAGCFRGTETHLLQDGEDCARGPELHSNCLGDARSLGVDIAEG